MTALLLFRWLIPRLPSTAKDVLLAHQIEQLKCFRKFINVETACGHNDRLWLSVNNLREGAKEFPVCF
jgi:hypothetical protein